MSIERTIRSNKSLLIILAAAILIFTLVPQLSAISYTTAYEGAKARFYGIYDLGSGKKYTGEKLNGASVARFDTTMLFDRDDFFQYSPNIVGEMTAVQIPVKENNWVPPDWVPREWWTDASKSQNPQNTYEWQIQNQDGSYTVYHMEEWITKWYISLSAGWDSGPGIGVTDETDSWDRYRNVEIWFELDISPVWYFEGQTEQPYFAIAKIEVSHYKQDGSPRVAPMSSGSILTIYSKPFGSSADIAPGENDIKRFCYQNTTLNPIYFTDKVYAKINLEDFGCSEWFDLSGWHAKGDVVTIGFTVTQFVVGQWTVKDLGNIPDDYGRMSKIGLLGIPFLESLINWLQNPFNLAALGAYGLMIVAVIVLVILVALFGPSIITRWFRRRD